VATVKSMMQQSTAHNGLGDLIRSAMNLALESGRGEAVSSLQAALFAVDPASDRFEIDLLAGEVRRGGQTISLSRGERALLIAMAFRRRPCSRTELVGMLYSHLDESTAVIQLKVYVHRVRRRLRAHNAIIYQNDAYRLGGNLQADFWEVDSDVAAALRSTAGLTSQEKTRLNQIRLRLRRRDLTWSEDQEWAAALERRLQAMLFDVCVRLGEAALHDGDAVTALQFASEVLEIDSCDERGINLAIRAHLVDNDRQAALRAYRRYERVLKSDLDATPSADLTALMRKV
jgi:DNA-binding SARP family transcriptional activator